MDDIKDLSFVILAAGKGTRMCSDLPKVMHDIADMPMINVLLNEVKSCHAQNCVMMVSGEGINIIKDSINDQQVDFIIQEKRLGTGHAVKIAVDNLNISQGVLMVLYGDTPFIKKETILKLASEIKQGKAVSVVGFNVEGDNRYGRLIVDGNNLTEIVEYNSASQKQKKITLCNSGVMALDLQYAQKLLNQIDNKNNKQEFYLTDIVSIAVKQGLGVSYIIADEMEVQGVNNKVELAKANNYYFSLLRDKMMQQGVTLINPETVFLSGDTMIGKDVIIEPNVVISSGVEIGDNVRIKSFSYIEKSKISDNVTIGPFARIRPGTEIASSARVGNFVEVKNSFIGEGSKVNHLSYIGDTELAENVNIGAGTITCNYDGYNKHKTKIAKEVFVGSNTALVAPVNVGEKAIIAAGSTITRDIEPNAVTIARSKQKDITDGAKKYRHNRQKTKD